jgi:hypothetical protein
MQLQHRYLLKNKITIVLNEAGLLTEYRPVYQRTLQIYKGIDNTLQFQLINADQKPVAMGTSEPVVVAFDENKNQIFERSGTVTDADKGLFNVVVADSDTLNVDAQYLTYTVYLKDSSTNTLTYTDESFDACGIMKINTCAFPGVIDSKTVTTFLEDTGEAGVDDSVWYSEALDAQPGINGNDALHTVSVYSDSYVGSITVQATLENQIVGTTKWAEVGSISFDGTETTPMPFNFNGVFSHIRFKASADPANKISKILVRN